MKFSLLASVAASAQADFVEIANTVNTGNSTWVADPSPSRFGTMEDAKTLCGTWLPGHEEYTEEDVPAYQSIANALAADSIDWRTESRGANCNVIRKIRDQSACGSCWAHGSTETFEDRRCIATGQDIEFSTEDTAGCCHGLFCGLSRGCNGGQPTSALKWMARTGVVTGGDFYDIGKSTAGCKPYVMQPCAHHTPPSATYPVCPQKEYSVTCEKTCSEKGYDKTYDADKVKGGSVSKLHSVEDMVDALQNGPISVAFKVYEDFPAYKSGVYKHVTGSMLGGHAVSIIGYGTDASAGDYWIVKNSWNSEWGDNGTFKIAKGNDECGIESMAAATIDF